MKIRSCFSLAFLCLAGRRGRRTGQATPWRSTIPLPSTVTGLHLKQTHAAAPAPFCQRQATLRQQLTATKKGLHQQEVLSGLMGRQKMNRQGWTCWKQSWRDQVRLAESLFTSEQFIDWLADHQPLCRSGHAFTLESEELQE